MALFWDVSNDLSKELSSSKLKVRNNAGNGLWLTVLLPSCLMINCVKYAPVSEIYLTSSIISAGFVINAIFGVFHKGNKPLRQIGSIASSLVLCSIFTLYFKTGVIFKLYYSILSSFVYHGLLLKLIDLCPFSFTYGEASVTAQGIILFCISSVENFIRCYHHHPKTCFEIATLILQVGFSGIFTICVLCLLLGILRKPGPFYAISFGILSCGVLPASHFFLKSNPIMWIFNLVSKDLLTIYLFAYWIFCTLVAIAVVAVQSKADKKASSAVRKYFHILAVAVYLPGLVANPCLIFFSSGIVLALFIVLELSRILNLPPLGKVLQNAFVGFADEKDEGPLALTPIYLLVGCSVPLWIHPHQTQKCDIIPLLAGVMSVGVGDTAASVFGSKFGKHFWSDSKKTKEGTFVCIVSQVFLLVILANFKVVAFKCILHPISAILIVSLVEAKTDQVDNLALPLLMYLLLII